MNDPIYEKLIRPLIFQLDAEKAHHLAMHWLSWQSKFPGFCRQKHLSKVFSQQNPIRLFGLEFPNHVGLAAGMDKDARALPAFAAMGFGHVEAGTVTPIGQPGNDQPRLFRYPKEEAVINRMGFNNEGATSMLNRIKETFPKGPQRIIPLGINLGKGKPTPLEDAAKDYVAGFRILAEQADYFTVNISSPNTPGLRELQNEAYLRDLLGALQKANHEKAKETNAKPIPILVKIAPDLDDHEITELLNILLDLNYDGIIATNTTIARPGFFESVNEAGGLSGLPVQKRSDEVIQFIHKETNGKLPIIGVGGIMDIDSAQRKLDLGASLIQIYTGLIYRGPGFVKALARGLS